jgi:hypothetical protein
VPVCDIKEGLQVEEEFRVLAFIELTHRLQMFGLAKLANLNFSQPKSSCPFME